MREHRTQDSLDSRFFISKFLESFEFLKIAKFFSNSDNSYSFPYTFSL